MKMLLMAASLLIASSGLAADPIATAVAAPSRPAADVALDAGRKPVEMLALARLKPGDHVLDVMAGQGYYSRLAADVVGPKGEVIALMPPAYMKDPKVAAGWSALSAASPQVKVLVGPPGNAALPRDIDLTIFHLTYHDLYWESEKYEYPKMDPAAFLAKLAAATRPGGKVLVVDHVGPAGVDPRVEAERTHRIDPAVVEADFAKAGFRLSGTSEALRNPADDIVKLVFDPAVRGKTDRRVWLFEKPKG